MSDRAKSEEALETLTRILSYADDENVLFLIWATHAIQDGRESFARKFFRYPREAVTTSIDSKYSAYKWDLETLLSIDLNTLKNKVRRNKVNFKDFEATVTLVNLIKSIEDSSVPERINDENIFMELHRIAHRQFGWQRGFVNKPDIYRYMYIYGQGDAAQYFLETNGISVSDFFACAFAYYTYLRMNPWCSPISNLDDIGISTDIASNALRILSDDMWSARRESRALLNKMETSAGGKLPVVYQPSYLRLKPIVRWDLGTRYQIIAPLPELIVMRATLGLYYDLQGGGTTVANDATKRFEDYARRSITAYCPGFVAQAAVTYKHKGNRLETPDILLQQAGRVVAVFECKATKLSFQAQYSDDPMESARAGYAQIAKAIFQLWRFFSHVRRGIVEFEVAADAPAIVLTMDAWTQMSHELRDGLIAEAQKISVEKEPDMIEEDRRYPIFCPIDELEKMLLKSNEEQLLAAFRAGKAPEYRGWSIENVRDSAVPNPDAVKEFAFDLGDLLPWWGRRAGVGAA